VLGQDLVLADALATGLCAAGVEGAPFVLAAGYSAIVVDHEGTARLVGDVPIQS